MSYVSLLKNIPEILSQPTGIAAIASVGIHSAIALIVPLMPVDSSTSSESNVKKAVGLMELSPADQNRLPSSGNTSQLALQPSKLPLQAQIPLTKFSNQTQIASALPTQTVLPPIPNSPLKYNLSYLPKKQSKPRFTRRDFRTQISNFRVRTSVPTSVPRSSAFVDDIDTKIKETQPLNINRLPQVQANNNISSQPLINPSADAIDIGSSRKLQGLTEQQKTEQQKINLSPKSIAIAPSSASRLSSRLSAAPIDVEVPSIENSQQQQTEANTLRQSDSQIQKSSELVAKLSSYDKLRKAIRSEYPDIKEQAVIQQTISTDKRDMEATVLGRLVVDPDGKVLELQFQDRSIAPELQSKTREFFNSNPPQNKKQISSYPFQLRFKNNNDVNLPEKNVELKSPPKAEVEKVSQPVESKNQLNKKKAVIIPQPSATPVVKETPVVNQNKATVISTESAQKLIKKLRQIKEEKQTPNPEN